MTVYSTPACTWCNTLRSYLKDRKINYRDIDVSVDQNAAEQMVNKSGQQGVPQIDIDGQVVVGFDKMRIDNLLES
ncbi:MAG TPA: NrdH-redoxin [Bacteroidales bacterium]|nr:NrdH-redoxin [Bacteroidales bacterium]